MNKLKTSIGLVALLVTSLLYADPKTIDEASLDEVPKTTSAVVLGFDSLEDELPNGDMGKRVKQLDFPNDGLFLFDVTGDVATPAFLTTDANGNVFVDFNGDGILDPTDFPFGGSAGASSITANVGNATPQIHQPSNTTLDPFDNNGTGLSATNQPAAIAELANKKRAWSPDGTQKTNADDVLFTDRISQNNGLTINSPTAAHPNTLYVSRDSGNGDGTARFDSTIGVRVNATDESTTTGQYDAFIYNSGRAAPWKFNQIRASSGDQILLLEGGTGGSNALATHGGGIALAGNQFGPLATQYPKGSVMVWSGMNQLTEDRARVMITNLLSDSDALNTNAIRKVDHGRGVNQTSLDLHRGVLGLRESFRGSPAQIPNRPDYVSMDTYGGALFLKTGSNSVLSPPNTVVQVTGHLQDIIEELQAAGVVPAGVEGDKIAVSPSYSLVDKSVTFSLLGNIFEVDLVTGNFSKNNGTTSTTGTITITPERLSIVQ